MNKCRFETWDIFSDMQFAGNPLAVVFDADGLSTQKMQTLAAEFNLSETVFILNPKHKNSHKRIRIFTPEFELPFAGHPTVGASLAIAKELGLEGVLNLELNAGLFSVETEFAKGKAFARFSNPNMPRQTDTAPSKSALALAVGLKENDILEGAHHPRRCGTGGVDYIYVHADLASVKRAKLNSAEWEALDLNGAVGVYLYAHGGVEESTNYHVRMFAPSAGVPEDPATGSAAAGFPAQIALAEQWLDRKINDKVEWQIEQGYEMGRPSLISVHVHCHKGEINAVSIGGFGVQVSEGVLLLD